MHAEVTAVVLNERVEALADALRDAGVDPDRASALLGTATEAASSALTLVSLLSRPQPGFDQAADSVAVEAAPALAA